MNIIKQNYFTHFIQNSAPCVLITIFFFLKTLCLAQCPPNIIVNSVSNKTFCSGETVDAINFSGAPSNTVFEWENNAPSMGLSTAGLGNTPSFMAKNNTGIPIKATIKVTPKYPLEVSTLTSASPSKILIIYSEDFTPDVLKAQLLALGLNSVDLFFGRNGTPTLSQLKQYDMVIPISRSSWYDGVTLGNNLADYLDAKGIVVAMPYDWSPYGGRIEGRWLTGGYTPYNNSPDNIFDYRTLGTYDASHPLMQGVTTLISSRIEILTLATGATQVAAWNDGNPLVAIKGRAVGINAYLGDNNGSWSGDFAKIIINAGKTLGIPYCTGTPISFNITINPTPSVSAGSDIANCNGSERILTATASGGIAPYAYTWSSGSAIVKPVITTTYTVTATDVNGCKATDDMTIFTEKTDQPIAINPIANSVYCAGDNISAINFTGTPSNAVFEWVNNSPTIGLASVVLEVLLVLSQLIIQLLL
jgi:hypothetical protein